MALATEPIYITWEEFQTFARVADQRKMSWGKITPYALHAEAIIDSYVGYVVPADSEQSLKFPTLNDDGESEMPDDLKRACIEITSDLIAKGEPSGNGDVKRESWSNSGYSREYVEGKKSESAEVGIPPLALRLLSQWAVGIAPATY